MWVPGQVLRQVGGNFLISLSLVPPFSLVNKELPSDYSSVCLPPGQLIQILWVLPAPKGKWHLFDLIPGGFCPPNKSMHGDVAFVTVLCSADGLDPTVEANGDFQDKRQGKSRMSVNSIRLWRIENIQASLTCILEMRHDLCFYTALWLLASKSIQDSTTTSRAAFLGPHFETVKLERDVSWCKVSCSSFGSQRDEYWIHHIPHSACSVSQIYCWHNSTFRDGTAHHIF